MLHVPNIEVGSTRERRYRDRRDRAQEEDDDRSFGPVGNLRDNTPVRGAVAGNRHGSATSKEANVTEVTNATEPTSAAGTATATASATGNTASNGNAASSAGVEFIVNAAAAAK